MNTTTNTLKPLYEIPQEVKLLHDADFCNDVLYYNYVQDGVRRCGGIRFEGVPAFRFRTERCSTVWHLDASETLVEVENSEWVKEIQADMEARYRDRYAMHHYMIYMTDFGAYEIIAGSWDVLSDKEGWWQEISVK